jgi:phosphoribosyl 1,2-cyclic phosphodiesterase
MKPGEEMKIHVLASGSKGNMVLISSDSGWVAIDCGISKRKIINKLAEIQLKIEDIKHLIITHEHSDHTAGLKALIQTGNIETIYLTQGTFDMTRESSQLNESIVQIIHPKKAFAIDGFTIESFGASHDAKEPVGFVLTSNQHKVVVGTDTGYIDQAHETMLKDADVYLIEANHHPQKLLSSPRPMHLKKRILGEKGHLNNDDAAMFINRVMGKKETHWIVMHISEDCNSERDIEKSIVEFVEDPLRLNVLYANQHDIVSVEL